MNRALPGHYVDLIRDGLSPGELGHRGDQAVYNALVRVAMSAVQRGWRQPEWSGLIVERTNGLGRQLWTRHTDGKTRSDRAVYRTLHKAWDTAETLTAQSPPIGEDEARQHAAEVAEFAANPDAQLPDAWRAILAHAAAVAHREGTVRPALPRVEIVEATGYGHRTVRTALAKLDGCGLLRIAVRGRAGIPKSSIPTGSQTPPSHLLGRATLYRLPSTGAMAAHLCPETGQVGPLVHTSRTPAFLADLDPSQTSRTPTPQEDARMVTIEAKGSAEELAAFFAALARSTGVQIVEPRTDTQSGNVVPLRGRDRRSA